MGRDTVLHSTVQAIESEAALHDICVMANSVRSGNTALRMAHNL